MAELTDSSFAEFIDNPMAELQGIVMVLIKAGELLPAMNNTQRISSILNKLNQLSNQLHMECSRFSSNTTNITNNIPNKEIVHINSDNIAAPTPVSPAANSTYRQSKRRPPLNAQPHHLMMMAAVDGQQKMESDRHIWRKYGEKPIKNSSFKRSYFRCKHSKSRGCPAKRYTRKCGADRVEIIDVSQHTCGLKQHPQQNPPLPGGGASNPPYDLHEQFNARYRLQSEGSAADVDDVEHRFDEPLHVPAVFSADPASATYNGFDADEECWSRSPLTNYLLSECDAIERSLRECSAGGSVDRAYSDVSSISDNDSVNYQRDEAQFIFIDGFVQQS